MKNLIILGFGNIGKIICDYAMLSAEYNKKWKIKGFLVFKDTDIVDDSYLGVKVIGSIEEYIIDENDVFICSFAQIADRIKSVELIEKKGGHFINIIHPSTNIAQTAKIGVGNFIGAFTTLSINTDIGNHIIIQDHCNIGHDCILHDYSHLYVGNIICGINTIEKAVTIYTGSTVYPKITIEKESVIGAGSVVIRKVRANTVVMGNPAKKIE